MNLRQNDTKRTVHAPAKLNLFLEVLESRDDGYHELETLLVPVRWFDSLSFKPLSGEAGRPGDIRFRLRPSRASTGPVPHGSANLVVRALELIRKVSGCKLGAEIELVKRIPSGAGLGGGSSDAAAALKLANRGWGIGYSVEKLTELAASLGSDVPFFLASGAAICRGRGEKVERLPEMAPLHVVIVKPPVELATPAVYRALDDLPSNPAAAAESRRSLLGIVGRLRQGNPVGLERWMTNRLQAAAAALSPWVDRIQAAFAELDFEGHQLSGSGSAYFGICRHAAHARRLAAILRTRQPGLVYVTRSCR